MPWINLFVLRTNKQKYPVSVSTIWFNNTMVTKKGEHWFQYKYNVLWMGISVMLWAYNRIEPVLRDICQFRQCLAGILIL